MENLKFEIAVKDLTMYNNDIIRFTRLDLFNPEQARERYQKLTQEYPDHEYIISDVQASFPLQIKDINLGINELIDFVEKNMLDWDEEEFEVFCALVENYDEYEKAAKIVNNGDYNYIDTTDYDSQEEAVGYYYAENYLNMNALPSEIAFYFDYKSYGREILISEYSVDLNNAVVIVY